MTSQGHSQVGGFYEFPTLCWAPRTEKAPSRLQLVLLALIKHGD